MSDIQVNNDGTLSEVDAASIERAVRERLRVRFLAPPFGFVVIGLPEPGPAPIVTTTLRVWELPR